MASIAWLDALPSCSSLARQYRYVTQISSQQQRLGLDESECVLKGNLGLYFDGRLGTVAAFSLRLLTRHATASSNPKVGMCSDLCPVF